GVQCSGGLGVRRRGSKTQKKRGASDTHHRAVSGFHESPRQKGATSQVGAIWNRGAGAALGAATAPPPQVQCVRQAAIAPCVLFRYSTVMSTIRAKMSGRSRWALSALKVNFPNGERP